MEQEIWKDVVGYEGAYQISNTGKVYSVRRGRNLSVSKNTNGYPSVGLKGKTVRIHRIIAESFIPNPDKKPCINHIDGNKANNDLSNLEWVTYRENIMHSLYVLGNLAKKPPAPQGFAHHKSKINNEEKMKRVYDLRNSGKTYKEIAVEMGVCRDSIKRLFKNKTYKNRPIEHKATVKKAMSEAGRANLIKCMMGKRHAAKDYSPTKSQQS